MKLSNLLLFTIFATVLCVHSNCQQLEEKQVISNGVKFVGFKNATVSYFLGIRYGQDTSGSNRFKTTVPFVYDQSSAVNASSYGYICPQPISDTSPLSSMSEDCLFLNVWTPMLDSQVEVLVWFHGGGFSAGSGSIYDGSYWCGMALEMGIPVVIVTINYRLGSLGFLSDNTSGLKGNYGLYDQLEAIRWVKTNIRNFGGNPEKITIAGESAGGMSVACLLSSTVWNTEKLFQQSIIQSGILPSTVLQNSLDGAQTWTNILKSRLNCYNVNCLREVSFEQFIVSQRNITFVPVIDGQLLTETIYQNLDKPNNPISNISMMVGTTANETTYFTCEKGSNLNIYQLYILFKTLFNMEPSLSTLELIAQVSVLYGGSGSYSSILQFFNTFMTDALFYCPSRYYSSMVSAIHQQPPSDSGKTVHQYIFSYVHDKLRACYGAPHASELPYLFPSILEVLAKDSQFSNLFSSSVMEFSDKDKKISDSMIHYWSSFVKYGNPNGENQTLSEKFVDWSVFNRCNGKQLIIDIPLNVEDGNRVPICNFWDIQFGRSKIERVC